MASSAASPASSADSFTVADVQSQAGWQAECSKLKVAQLDELLRNKGAKPRGLKAEKAERVAWLYTRQEIQAWRAAQEPPRQAPANLVQGAPQGQRRLLDYFCNVRMSPWTAFSFCAAITPPTPPQES